MSFSPRFVTAALLVGALGCDGPSGVTDPIIDTPSFVAAEPGTELSTFDVDFTEESPLCTDEAIHWTGTVRIVYHLTNNRGLPVSSGLVQHEITIQSVRLTGVGETSGETYSFVSTSSASLQAPAPTEDPPATLTVTARDRIFGPEGGLLGLGMFSFKLLITPAGELLIEDPEFTAQCR